MFLLTVEMSVSVGGENRKTNNSLRHVTLPREFALTSHTHHTRGRDREGRDEER